MKTLFETGVFPKDACPHSVEQAKAEDKQLLKIVWDDADGYPEHARGYVQWSIRPYTQWYGCDGTTDENIHLIAKTLCEALGLNYATLYEQAYNRPQDTPPGESWLRLMTAKSWARIEAETIIPELSEINLCGILDDLHEINNHSFANLLEDVFTSLGYNVDQYWLRGGPHA